MGVLAPVRGKRRQDGISGHSEGRIGFIFQVMGKPAGQKRKALKLLI
jgi:hypothetical protein